MRPGRKGSKLDTSGERDPSSLQSGNYSTLHKSFSSKKMEGKSSDSNGTESPGLNRVPTSKKLEKVLGTSDSSADFTRNYPKEQEEMRQEFDLEELPQSEVVQYYANVTFNFDKSNADKGRCYLTQNYLCFFSERVKHCYPYRAIIAIEKKSKFASVTLDIVTDTMTYSYVATESLYKHLNQSAQKYILENASIFKALEQQNEARVTALLRVNAENPAFFDTSQDGILPIHAAFTACNFAIIMEFLDFYRKRNRDINVKDKDGWTVLHQACSYSAGTNEQDQILIKLLDYPGIRVDVENASMNTPLHYFCEKFQSLACQEMGKTIINKGASVNKRNSNGETPLHKAVFNRAVRIPMVEMLIKFGADVNVANTRSNETALHYAVHLKRKDLIKVLLFAGASMTVKSKSNQTPYELAVAMGEAKSLDLLAKAQELYDWLKGLSMQDKFLKFVHEELFLDVISELEEEFVDKTLECVDITTAGAKLRVIKAIKELQKTKLGSASKIQSPYAAGAPNASSGSPTRSGSEGSQDFAARLAKAQGAGGISMGQEGNSENLSVRNDFSIESNFLLDHTQMEYTSELGSGGAGTVYRGLYKGKPVAIKVLKVIDDGTLEDFRKEFQVLSVLRHPHIVEFYGGCLKPRVCMVMELCARQSLFHVLSDQKLPIDWDMALRFMVETADSMNYLHTRDPPFFHRDMKSLNLLVTEGWSIKLTDFGLTRSFSSANMKTMQNMVGTVGWTAPELLYESGYSSKCDVYSVAIVFWEIIHRAFKGKYVRPYGEYQDIKNDLQIVGLTAEKGLRPTIPDACPRVIADLVRSMWAKDATQRPSMQAVYDTVKRVQSEGANASAQSSSATSPSPSPPSGSSASSPSSTPTGTPGSSFSSATGMSASVSAAGEPTREAAKQQNVAEVNKKAVNSPAAPTTSSSLSSSSSDATYTSISQVLSKQPSSNGLHAQPNTPTASGTTATTGTAGGEYLPLNQVLAGNPSPTPVAQEPSASAPTNGSSAAAPFEQRVRNHTFPESEYHSTGLLPRENSANNLLGVQAGRPRPADSRYSPAFRPAAHSFSEVQPPSSAPPFNITPSPAVYPTPTPVPAAVPQPVQNTSQIYAAPVPYRAPVTPQSPSRGSVEQWFFGEMNRVDAEHRLLDTPFNCFLVRTSKHQQQCYVISKCKIMDSSQREAGHWIVSMNALGRWFIQDTPDDTLSYATLAELISNTPMLAGYQPARR